MTDCDPRTAAPRRTTRFSGVVILMILVLFLIAGAFVWIRWSADARSAADNAAGHTVQPAELPPPDAGSTSPEGAEAPR